MFAASGGQAKGAQQFFRGRSNQPNNLVRQIQAMQGGGAAGQTQNALQTLLGLTNQPVDLAPLQAQFRDNLDYAMSAINASSPGRFSTANAYTQGQASQRAINDYNVLAANLMEQGRNRQLNAIMGLLGPVLGPMFGGPFTQDASPWENILGGAQSIAGLAGGIPSFAGLPFVNPSL